jgi:tRNA U38,U39,U40 pseudouridine synthase TruA
MERICGSMDKLTLRLNALFAPLVGVSLPYIALSYGRLKTRTSNCTLYHAHARVVQFDTQPVLSIEFTGDRFLRRMVRILVSTALSLGAASDAEFDEFALLQIIQSRERRKAALPAPSQGLIFVTASYDS